MSPGRRVSFVGIALVLWLSIMLGIGEVLARALITPTCMPAPPAPRQIDPYQPNPYFFFARPYLQIYVPGSTFEAARSSYRVTYHINRQGFRGPEIAGRETVRLKRLLAIGDSLVEGHGVEFDQTFAELLGQHVRDSGWEVINAGVAGASPIYYASNVPRYLSLEPDAALIVIFENDLTDDRAQEARFFSLPLLDEEGPLLRGTVSETGCRPWRLYTAARRVWNDVHRSPIARIVARNRATPVSNGEQEQWTGVAPFLIAPSMIDRQWTMSQAYLDYAVESLRRHHVTVLIASLCFGTLTPHVKEPYYRTHCHQLDDRVAAWANRSRLPFLSLLPAISDLFTSYRPVEIMLDGDGHPTPLAHAMIERALLPWIVGQLAVADRGRAGTIP